MVDIIHLNHVIMCNHMTFKYIGFQHFPELNHNTEKKGSIFEIHK